MDEEFFDVTTSSIKDSEELSQASDVDRKGATRARPVSRASKAVKSYSSYQPQATFLYHPDAPLPDLAPYIGGYIEVRAERCYVSAQNKNVRARRLYGGDDYASHSDSVAVALHAGLAREEPRRAAEALGLIFKVTNGKRTYAAVTQNGLRSQPLSAAQNAQPFAGQTLRPIAARNFACKADFYKLAQRVQLPAYRRKAAPRDEQRRYPSFGETVFNMNGELALRYTLTNICDKSPKERLSTLLRTHFLVVETRAREKFIFCVGRDAPSEPLFRLYSVARPTEYDNECAARRPFKETELLRDDLLWAEIVWGDLRVDARDFVVSEPANFKLYKL